ncbi:MAG: magnesium transporter [Lysobacteraceae bacterium]
MNSETQSSLLTQLGCLDPRSAADLLADQPDARIADLLSRLHIGHAVEVLEEFEPARRETIAAAVPFGREPLWLVGHTYPEGTVGRLMERPPAVFAPGATVDSTIATLREIIRQRMVVYVFVTEADGRLVGVVAFRELVFADPHARLADIMLGDPFFLRPEQKFVEAMREVVKRHFPIYPVCDEAGRLMGVVKGQALFEQQAFEISAQAGSMVGVEKEERMATPWQRSFRFRNPWLLLNMLIAFGTATVVGMFDKTMEALVVLAAFVPVMLGQCSNLGAQALAVTIRGMTLGELDTALRWRVLAKEAGLGLLNGAVSGLLAGTALYFAAGSQTRIAPLHLALAIFTAMSLSCMLSGTAGAAIPMLLRRFGLDPATASAIFLSAVTDISSTALFLGLVAWMLMG